LSGGNTAATLRAAAEGISGVNAAMAYGTDGAIAALGLVALCDDKHAQIVYAPVPVIRASVLDAHPQIAPALDRVFATLSRERLQELNARIAVEGEDARTVAGDYFALCRPRDECRRAAAAGSHRPRPAQPCVAGSGYRRDDRGNLLRVCRPVAEPADLGQPVALWSAAGAGFTGALGLVARHFSRPDLPPHDAGSPI